MAEATSAGGERRKWMIVGGLSLAFIAVLWVQLSPAPDDPPATSLAERPRRPAAAQAAASTLLPWPRFPLAEVLRHNPFAPLPKPESRAEAGPEESETPAEAAATPEAALNAMKARRVRAVFMTEKGP